MDNEQKPSVVHHTRKPINKKTKLRIVFDEAARRDFLSGFRKRKLQRKKAAMEDFEKKLKEEKKRIKSQSREQHKKLVRSYRPIPVLEEQLAQEFKVEDTTVSVLELDTDLLAETNFLIGNNKVKYEEPQVKKEAKDEGDEVSDEEELPGMELKTKKEVQKELKLHALEEVKKSKVFKQKEKMERDKQKKKAMQQKRIKRKEMKKLIKKKPHLKKKRK